MAERRGRRLMYPNLDLFKKQVILERRETQFAITQNQLLAVE
jgi:hypothetical protein